jgi:large subunit ribosomal protein L17
MNQAEVAKLMSQLKIAVRPRHRNLKNVDGPEGKLKSGVFSSVSKSYLISIFLGRLNKLRKTVTALIKHERLEMNYNRADEARGYAERVRVAFIQRLHFYSVNFQAYLGCYSLR